MRPTDPFTSHPARMGGSFHAPFDAQLHPIMSRESGLSMSQISALFHIHQADGSGVTDLGDHLGVTSAAASQMLERLVQQELILRTEDPDDRRVKQMVLTEKGARVSRRASMPARVGWTIWQKGSPPAKKNR